ncbi:FAD:protein FMN transferase [Pedobacter caeni]|uniref:FAD:protein FMN transferase n=1 Tax=Pedobacter caeni TaxID=288992 RepID=A0A1M5PWA7_9SPHI|nr:FAD:protein FMN transferase [Pedobacter caeni]SHH06307.1 thiamine biosynthesis lipoprotein [Pedobacter caeni]
MAIVPKSAILLLPLLVSLFIQKKDQQQYSIHGYAQGTDYSIKYFAEDSVVTKRAVDSILLKIDSSMSLYKPYSLISEFNRSEKGILLDAHFARVIRKSFEIYKATQGRFDVTVAPLVQAWGFGPKAVDHFPDRATVKALLGNVGMNYLELEGNYLRKKKPGVTIDLNGIAQGYSVDVVADYLIKKGISAFVVEIGGELRVLGPKPDGSAMRIGIEGPATSADSEPEIRHVLSFSKGAVTTSGNYRKYLQKGKRKIAHLINPKTGYPLDNQLISATIYAKDAITADGYDNAVMAMSMEEALAFVAARKDMEAYLIYHRKDGTVADTLSRGFKKMMLP